MEELFSIDEANVTDDMIEKVGYYTINENIFDMDLLKHKKLVKRICKFYIDKIINGHTISEYDNKLISIDSMNQYLECNDESILYNAATMSYSLPNYCLYYLILMNEFETVKKFINVNSDVLKFYKLNCNPYVIRTNSAEKSNYFANL